MVSKLKIKSSQARKTLAKNAVKEWMDKFIAQHGREPTKAEKRAPEAARLFKDYNSSRQSLIEVLGLTDVVNETETTGK
jgi:hypothetical protein